MQQHAEEDITRQVAVTGASSGIGRAVSTALLAKGHHVLGIDIAGPPVATGGYRHLMADLSSRDGIMTAQAALGERAFDAFVHAAGVMRSDTAPDIAAALGESLWALHVAAPQRLCDAVLPRMPDRTGRIVLISSRASRGRAGRGLYAASKAGSEALVRSLALAALPRGITVNAVAPGAVETAQTRDPLRADAPVATPPIGRMIEADEVAATVLFLLSGASGAITGQTIFQCGGHSLLPPSQDPNVKGGPHAPV